VKFAVSFIQTGKRSQVFGEISIKDALEITATDVNNRKTMPMICFIQNLFELQGPDIPAISIGTNL